MASAEGMPVRLFSSPLEWMRAAGASGVLDCTVGSVILDWRRAAELLAGLVAVECDPHMVDSLGAALRPLPRAPEVSVWKAAA